MISHASEASPFPRKDGEATFELAIQRGQMINEQDNDQGRTAVQDGSNLRYENEPDEQRANDRAEVKSGSQRADTKQFMSLNSSLDSLLCSVEGT